MPRRKEAAKPKRLTKTMPVLGAAGLSFSLAIGTCAAIGSINPDPATSAPVAEPVMDEEEISDTSLATFHVFDNERIDPRLSGTRPTMLSQGACGADLYFPQNPPAVSGLSNAPTVQASADLPSEQVQTFATVHHVTRTDRIPRS
jgi:hypothetical protein